MRQRQAGWVVLLIDNIQAIQIKTKLANSSILKPSFFLSGFLFNHFCAVTKGLVACQAIGAEHIDLRFAEGSFEVIDDTVDG